MTNSLLAVLVATGLIGLHLGNIPINSKKSVAAYWRSHERQVEISKLLLVLALSCCALIVVEPVIGITGALVFGLAHALFAIRK